MKNRMTFRFGADLIKRALLTLSLIGLLTSHSNSQTATSGSLRVSVVDAQGAVVSGATVILKREDTGQEITGVTGDNGTVTLVNLQPGTYKVTVQLPGFKQLEQSVTIGVNQTNEVTFSLTPGLRTVETVNIVSEAGAVERRESISSLPNQNNDLGPVFHGVPGVVPLGSAALGRVVIDGKGLDQQTTRLDGVDFTVLADLPTSDAAIDPVSSFSSAAVAADLDNQDVAKGAFEAHYGPGTGAVVSNVTYGPADHSTNRWTGEFFGENRNDAFNARNFFDYDGKNSLRRTRFGGKASRAFDQLGRARIFLAAEGLEGRVERDVYEAIPIDALSSQAFGTLMRSYLPAGTQVVSGASTDPNFAIARRRTRTSVSARAFDARFEFYPFAETNDHRLANVFSFRYTGAGSRNIVPDGVTGREQRQRILFHNLLAGYTFNSSLNTTHTLRFGLNHVEGTVKVNVPVETDSSLSAAMISLDGTVNAQGLPPGTTSVPIAAVGGLVNNLGRGFELQPTSYSLIYDVERKFHNDRHILNAGVEGRFITSKIDRSGGITYSFNDINALRSGNAAAVTFQSDLSAASPFSNGVGMREARQHYLMGYIQMVSQIGAIGHDPTDTRKDRARLRLTYGLRYDYFAPVHERDNRAVIIDPVTGEILPPGSSFYRTEKFNFQPRFSLVYRLGETGFLSRTVLTSSVGIYSGTGKLNELLLPIESDRVSMKLKDVAFPVTPQILFDNFAANRETRQFQPLSFSRDFTGLERAYKWDLKLAQTVGGYNINLLYSGNESRNLPLANIGNKIIHVATNPDPSKEAIVTREFDIVRGGEVFKPFGELLYRTGGGRNSYNALTVELKRNLHSELEPGQDNPWYVQAVRSLTTQYTLSRNVGNVSGTVLSNPFEVGADFGDNIGTPRHLFKVSAVYQLWTAKGRRATDWLLGWKIMPLFKVTSGLPLIVRLNRPDVVYVDSSGSVFKDPAVGRTAVINTPGGGESAAARVPDILSGQNPYLKNDREFLNPAAFAIPAPGMFGNLRRGQLRGPAVAQLDLSLRRNLFQTEKAISAQFQIDIFNVFNRTNFLNPTTALPNALGDANNQLQPGVPFTRASAGGFGILSAADQGRTIQFSLTFRLNNGFTTYVEPK